MIVEADFHNPPTLPKDHALRWSGPDKGLVAAWMRGIEKRLESPELAAQCERGELPVLACKGGCERYIKTTKIGSLLYLATWQALRGENLCIDMSAEPMMRCSRTGTNVVFTLDIKKLFKEAGNGRSGD